MWGYRGAKSAAQGENERPAETSSFLITDREGRELTGVVCDARIKI